MGAVLVSSREATFAVAGHPDDRVAHKPAEASRLSRFGPARLVDKKPSQILNLLADVASR